MRLDLKFYGEIRKVKDDSIVPEDQFMVFLAKDNAFLPTLYFYFNQCVRIGADAEQVAAVDRAIKRVEAWRDAHPDLCKVPDAKGEKLLG